MLTRTIVSLILVPTVVGVVFLAPPGFFILFVFLVAQFTFLEYLKLVPVLRDRSRQLWLMALAAVIVLAYALGSEWQAPPRILLILLATLLAVAIQAVFTVSNNERVLATVASSVFGLVYIPFSLALLIPTRFTAGDLGRIAILFLLLVTWAGDIGAYLVGRSIGSHKLAPSISPGKTIEGAVAGLACALGTGFAFSFCFNDRLGWPLAALFNVVGQSGDLFESMLKRGAGVKDSSQWIPGHGGFLDRIDSLLFCCPILYFWQLARSVS